MDTSRIKQIINITLNGVPTSQYTWTTTRVNLTSYKINIDARVSLNQMTLSLVFLNPSLVIDSQGTIIDATQIISPLPSFDYISPQVKASTMGVTAFSGIISYLALAILLILLIKGSYALLLVFEVFQMIYFHYFIIQDLPYNFSNFLLNLKFLNFQFLPSLFNLMIPSTYSSQATPQKYKQAITDTTFFISSGHYFLVIAFYVFWVLVISLLKNRQLNKFRKVRRFAKDIYQNRIRYGAINQCIWYCFMTFVLFGLWQFYDITFPYTWSYANFIVAMLCLGLCIGMVCWVVHLTLKYRNNIQEIPKKYKFILGQDSTLPYQIPLRYIRKLLICLFLFTGMIQLQAVGMIAANFIILAFYGIYRPSKYRFNNYINILIQLCYIGLQLCIIFYANDFDLQTQKKLIYGTAMIAFSSIALIMVVIWLIWQFLQFLYDFKFIRDIVQETKLANKIYPEEDNLKIDLQKDYNKDQIVSHVSGLGFEKQNQDQEQSRNFQEDTIVGIEKQYDAVLHYDQKTVDKPTGKNKDKNKKNNNRLNVDRMSDEKSSVNQPRLISSRNTSRMLFADINIEDIE